ncbi:hypothetical protein P4S72_18245 [Vibrio sp. PP-XX7]
MGYLASMVGVFIARSILNYGSQRFTFEAAARLRTELRARLFNHIHELGPAWARSNALVLVQPSWWMV